jgi:uncharacterized protein YggE
MKPLILAGAIAVLAAAAAPAPAQPAPGDAQFAATTLDLGASGEVSVAPDMATITMGVTNQAPSADEALRDNAEGMNRAVAALRAAGLEARDIQTSNLSLNPQYVYNQGQPPRLSGYEASNQVTITVRDLARLGPVVDAVVKAGATNVSQISFGLKSRVPAENAARLSAIKALEDKAALYADATGYHIRRLVNLAEGASYSAPPPRPLMAMARASLAAAPTPVETGELKVRIDVTGEFELTH